MNVDKAIKIKLKALNNAGRTLSEIAEMLDVSASSVHCYIKDTQRIPPKRYAEFTAILGIDMGDIGEDCPPVELEIPEGRQAVSMSTREAAKLLGKSKKFVEQGLQQGRFPWGWAVMMKRWEYWISPIKFAEYTGIEPLGGAECQQN